jgi:transcriptional regulator with XRE-family HTH domain
MGSKILITIGDQIRVHRTKKKLSQENMANELGISVAAYSRIERGQTNVSINRLEQISACLDVSIPQLMVPVESDYYAGGSVGVLREESSSYLSERSQREFLMYMAEKLMPILEERLTRLLEERLARLDRDTAGEDVSSS